MLSSAPDKKTFCAANFSEKSNLDYSGISLPAFPSRTNLKLHNFPVTPKLVSGPDFIPVVVLKNCEPEVSYI